MSGKVITILFVLGLGVTPSALGDSISNLLTESLKITSPDHSVESTVESSTLNRVVPIRSLEYQYGAEENESNQTHILRFNLKSPTELLVSGESHRLAQDLNRMSESILGNESRYLAYRRVVDAILLSRTVALLSERQRELERIVEKNVTMMSAGKTNVKEILRESLGVQQLQGELAVTRGRLDEKMLLDQKKAESYSQSLRSRALRLAERALTAAGGQSLESVTIQRKSVEARLERIDQEVKWADERKIFSHVDLRHDTENQDNSIRVGINIPFAHFDQATREREAAVLRAKEVELELERQDDQANVATLLRELSSLTNALKVVQAKLEKMGTARKRLRDSRDVEVLMAVKQTKFDLDREAVELTLELYSAYLGLLRELGFFSKMAATNFLDPQWADLK